MANRQKDDEGPMTTARAFRDITMSAAGEAVHIFFEPLRWFKDASTTWSRIILDQMLPSRRLLPWEESFIMRPHVDISYLPSSSSYGQSGERNLVLGHGSAGKPNYAAQFLHSRCKHLLTPDHQELCELVSRSEYSRQALKRLLQSESRLDDAQFTDTVEALLVVESQILREMLSAFEESDQGLRSGTSDAVLEMIDSIDELIDAFRSHDNHLPDRTMLKSRRPESPRTKKVKSKSS